MKKLTLALPILAAAAALTLSACGGGGGSTPSQTSGSSLPSGAATMANPAAEYCVQQGGTLDNASGMCTLPNGTKIDEWELYNSAHPDSDTGSSDNDSDSDNG